jgi:flavin reductase
MMVVHKRFETGPGLWKSAGPAMADAPPPEVFREAMSHVVAAVHILTSDGVGGRAGLTASAVQSVSDNPATMLACINRASHSAGRFIANGAFCINTLAPDAIGLAETFAGRTGMHGEARFDFGQWQKLATGSPVLASAIAVFDCRLLETTEVATHHILLGQVVAIRIAPGATASLTYANRRYRSLNESG